MIKTTKKILSKGLLLAALLIFNNLSGCGGSGNVATSSTSGEGGTSGTGVFAASVGKSTISGFDGLSTGGINYNIDAAIISFNGQQGSESQLETGMVIEVNAEVDTVNRTGTATSIVFTYSLAGVIDEINLATRTMSVLGQEIIFDEFTTFKNASSSDLSVGDVILLSGFTDADERVLATYIEKSLTTFSNAILEGMVSQINASNTTFKIGRQWVNYSGAQLQNIENNILESGDLVRVSGMETVSAPGVIDTVLLATTVEGVTGALAGGLDEEIRIEGVISQLAGLSGFQINGNSITTNISTEFINGLASDVAINSRVFVIGVLNSNGIISAEVIRFILPADIIIEAIVDAIDVADKTISLIGREIAIDAFTVFLDRSDANIQSFSLSDIATNDRLRVSGQDDGQHINAARIERVESLVNNSLSILEGVVENTISSPQFSLGGLTIDTSDLQDLNGFSQGGVTPITSSTFFTSLQPEMVARVLGEFQSGRLIPSHIEIVHCCNWEVYDGAGNFIGGGNDVAFTWDGTLNTNALSNNVNATLSTNAIIVGGTSVAQDVRVFGPGDYVFDTGLDSALTTDFGTTNLGGTPLRLTVGPGQMGVHGLFHYGTGSATTVCGKPACNIDLVFLWDVNAVYKGSDNDDSNLGAKGQVFNFSSVDGNGDGVPGIPVVDGPFAGFNTVYNLNITAP